MSGCVVKFSGTHIQHGYLKAGIAVFPAESARSYVRHYVPKPIIPEGGYPGAVDERGIPRDEDDFQAWLESLPTRMELNPVFVHFIQIDHNLTKTRLESEIQRIFTPNLLTSADAFLSTRGKDERADFSRFRKMMANPEVLGSGLLLPPEADFATILDAKHNEFKDIVGELDGKGKIVELKPGTIDIGAAAIDRSSSIDIDVSTKVGKENPSNEDGEITSCEIWLSSNNEGSDVWVGTFSASGNVLTCRDSESIGNVPAGSKQSYSGLSINVQTGDYLGAHDKAGDGHAEIERDMSGDGYWVYAGECIDPSDSETFSWTNNRTLSLYGEGEEPVTEKESADTGLGVDAAESLETPQAKTSSDTGSAVETADVEGEGQPEDRSASESAEGADRLVAKIEMPTKGGGMKLWT